MVHASLSHVAGTGNVRLRRSDVVAVALSPGPTWLDVVPWVWASGAALLPVDHRLPGPARRRLLDRARPTVELDDGGWSRRRAGVPADEGVVLVVATSGTAGRPKLAQFTQEAVLAAVEASATVLEASPDEPWLSCLPPAHVGGLLVVLRGTILGAPVIMLPRFDVRLVADARDARFTSLVPAMLIRLLDAGVELSNFRRILVGAGGMSAEVRTRVRDAGAPVIQTYGLTESCGGAVYDGFPLPGTRVRIEPARSAIELHGPSLMLGYRFDEPATTRAFTVDGWLRTADAGRLGPDGSLRVLGRLDDLIRTGGEGVWPDEVEEALRDHPKVAEIAVIGRLDTGWGQRVIAFVVPADPSEPPTLQELRDHAIRSLPRHAAPRELVVTPGPLPRSASGKVRRSALR